MLTSMMMCLRSACAFALSFLSKILAAYLRNEDDGREVKGSGLRLGMGYGMGELNEMVTHEHKLMGEVEC